MGSLAGHVGPGIGFLLIGLWHLLNHIKLHTLHPLTYSGPPWFPGPTRSLRYVEPYLIMSGTLASILTELFISPHRHHPLDVDGTIPSNHLHTFEHASISLALLVYAAFLVLIDKSRPKTPHHMAYFLASVALAQEYLLFRLHSTDHTGPEGQYHLFLQLIIMVSIATTLMGIAFPGSFMVSYVRSLSVVFQGVWFIVTGIMLWTPPLLPKGCFLNNEDGRRVARCSGEESNYRAKSLINLEFSWYLTGTAVFGVLFYLALVKFYDNQRVEYSSLPMREEKEQDSEDVEAQKKSILANDSI